MYSLTERNTLVGKCKMYIVFQDNKRSGLQPPLSITRMVFFFQHLKGEGTKEHRRASYRNPEEKS